MSRGALAAACAVVFLYVLLPAPAAAGFCWSWSSFGATDPEPWQCFGCDDGVCPNDVLGQTIRHEHRNWHCSNPVVFNEPYGRAFLAFHRQFILDFDNWRLANTSLGRFEPWDAFQNSITPGNDESTATPFTHCSTSSCTGVPCFCSEDASTPCTNDGDCVGTCQDIRKTATACTTCANLPAAFVGSNLNNFNSLGEVGYNLEQMWHGSYHSAVSQLGCADVATTVNTTYDPAFWMAHKKLDEVSRDWQALQAADVVIVVDRSGSMDDNCSSTTPPLNESPCAINDARHAAHLFAKIVEDVRMDGGMPAAQQHRIGLVSFANTASPDLGLTPANGIATGDLTGDTAFETELINLTTGGGTSIAAGIREAISILNGVGDPNPHQAILVLTDGKENVPPCLEGDTLPCQSGDVLTEGEVGDIQIVAIGVAEGAEENHLRDVAERHGGIFVAQGNVNDDLSLTKFYLTAFGEIYDEGVSLDPRGTMPAGATATAPFDIPICDETKLSVALGAQEVGDECDLEIELFTPGGDQVDRMAPGVEAGHSRRHDFLRVQLPYNGESTGTWTARIVRPPGAANCTRQNYFYTVLGDGLGRIDPFVKRPDVIVGRTVLATFRMTESNRPSDDWDSVVADVTLTRQDGPPETMPLFDDGTNGDRMEGNNVWSAEFPNPVAEPGVYHLRGHFELTEGTCTKIRESEYSIVALPQPADCASLACNQILKVRAGESMPLGSHLCGWNRCASDDQYVVMMSDERNWLKTPSPATGELVDLPPDFLSEIAPAFDHECLGVPEGAEGGDLPVFTSVPDTALPGDASVISLQISSVNNPRAAPQTCTSTLLVFGPRDCNLNGQDDAVDIATGVSQDANNNGRPDECEEDFAEPQVTLSLDALNITWPDLGEGARYDIVEGSLVDLRIRAGDYSSATLGCLADDLAATSVPHNLDPQPGEGHWFLARYVLTAGNGSYESHGPGEMGDRDGGIAASGLDCR